MTIGERIKARRLELGLSVEEVAEALGKNRATIYRYESNEIEKLPTTVLEPLANVLGVSPGYLMGWEKYGDLPALMDKYDNIKPLQLKKFPMLGKIACGEPIWCDEDKESYVMADMDINADFCLTAKGDSMINARIYDGDIVFIRQMPMVDNGDIAAVIIDNEATLKRVYYYPDKNKLVLSPENPAYEPLVYINEELDEIRILGKAVYFMSPL
ncbi:MAG: LexA family protein [Oscillospiraceae bacterium]